jgi:hypothetical protein
MKHRKIPATLGPEGMSVTVAAKNENTKPRGGKRKRVGKKVGLKFDNKKPLYAREEGKLKFLPRFQ